MIQSTGLGCACEDKLRTGLQGLGDDCGPQPPLGPDWPDWYNCFNSTAHLTAPITQPYLVPNPSGGAPIYITPTAPTVPVDFWGTPLSPTVPANITYTPRVQLLDTTNGTSLSGFLGSLGVMTEGDSFVYNMVGGAPNATVTVYNNGNPAGVLGTTDASGAFSFGGTWTSGNVGTIQQSFKIGSDVTNTLNTVVVAKAIVPVPVAAVVYNPRVQLIDTTNGSTLSGLKGLAGFSVGDTFSLSISGAKPMTPVYVQQVDNGTQAGNSQVGNTDSNGNFLLTKTWQASDAGLYQQYWTVGTDVVQPSPLIFTVLPVTTAVPVVPPVVVPVVQTAPLVDPTTGASVATVADTLLGSLNPLYLAGGIGLLALLFLKGRD